MCSRKLVYWLTRTLPGVLLQCGGKLQRDLDGPAYDVFAKALRGLAAAKLTKPGSFRTADGSGYAIRCSYKVSCSHRLGGCA